MGKPPTAETKTVLQAAEHLCFVVEHFVPSLSASLELFHDRFIDCIGEAQNIEVSRSVAPTIGNPLPAKLSRLAAHASLPKNLHV